MTAGVDTAIRELPAEEILVRTPELAEIWPDASRDRVGEILPRHVVRDGFRFLAAFDGDHLVGFVYGYRGGTGQWWHDRVALATTTLRSRSTAAAAGRRSCPGSTSARAARSSSSARTSNATGARRPPSRFTVATRLLDAECAENRAVHL